MQVECHAAAGMEAQPAALAAQQPEQGVPALEGVQGPQGRAVHQDAGPGHQVGEAPAGRCLVSLAEPRCQAEAG